MFLKKKTVFNKNYLIILFISIIAFSSGVFFHDAKLAYHLKHMLIKKSVVSKNFIQSFFFNKITELKIDIPFKTLEYMKKNLSIAIKYNDINEAENKYKPAKITFNDKVYKTKIRLKGLTNFHRLGNKKSLKIKISEQEDGLIPSMFGLSRFNLMDPKRRSNEKEWLFRKVAKKEGLIERRYDFVKVIINGDKFGIYSIEENFSKEFFEYNKIKIAPIISFDVEKIHGVTKFTDCCGHIWINDFNFSPVQSGKKIYNDKNFNTQYSYAKKNLIEFLSGNIKPIEIINLEKFAKFLALADMFGGWHGNETSNLKLYFNPYNKLLEPIPDDMFDEPRDKPSRDFALFKIRNIGGYSVFYEKLFNSNNFLKIYYKYLQIYSDEKFINSVLKEHKNELSLIERKIAKDDLYFANTIEKRLVENSRTIKEFINPKYPVEIIQASKDDNNSLIIDLQNNFYFPIKLQTLSFDDKVYELNQILNPKRISLNSLFEGAFFEILKKPKRTKIEIKLNEKEVTFKNPKLTYFINENDIKFINLNDLKLVKFEKNIKSNLEDFEDQIFIDRNLKRITLKNNILKIDKDLVFPSGFSFEVDSNSVIVLENNSNLIFESDFYTQPEKDIKVDFISTGKSCIIFKNNKIKVQNMSFEGFANCEVSGIYLTGGINFYNSQININKLSAKNNKSGDDLINIVNSKFELNNLYMENSLYDALDIDYSEGNIINIKCLNCGIKKGGDGIDLANSNIFIENAYISNSFDKGLSIGENSQANIKNLIVQEANVCIANKDGSYTKIKYAEVKNCNIGLAAFNKKSYYDISKLEISVVNFDNNVSNILRDNTNKIILGGWEVTDPATINNKILEKIYE